jgi:protein-histidine pros-kinase
MQLPIQRANHAFTAFMLSLAAVFIVLIVAINVLLMYLVIRPVNLLSNIASEVSLGNLTVPDFETSGKDEIASLAEAFRRMRRSLVEAIKMLEN